MSFFQIPDRLSDLTQPVTPVDPILVPAFDATCINPYCSSLAICFGSCDCARCTRFRDFLVFPARIFASGYGTKSHLQSSRSAHHICGRFS